MVLMPLLSRLLTLLVILTMPLFLARLTLIPIKSLSICRSEERFSRNDETEVVCRLLLENKYEGQLHFLAKPNFKRCSPALHRVPALPVSPRSLFPYATR